MSIHSFLKAVARTEPAPCTKFACAKQAQCASDKLACSAFRYYVSTGRSCSPCIEFPLWIATLQQPYETDGPSPTREVYDSLNRENECDESVRRDTADVVCATAIRTQPNSVFALGAVGGGQ